MWVFVEQGRSVRGGASAGAPRRFPVRGIVIDAMGNGTPAVAYELFARRPPHRRPEASGSALAHCAGEEEAEVQRVGRTRVTRQIGDGRRRRVTRDARDERQRELHEREAHTDSVKGCASCEVTRNSARVNCNVCSYAWAGLLNT